jgi:hypothetical protein
MSSGSPTSVGNYQSALCLRFSYILPLLLAAKVTGEPGSIVATTGHDLLRFARRHLNWHRKAIYQ